MHRAEQEVQQDGEHDRHEELAREVHRVEGREHRDDDEARGPGSGRSDGRFGSGEIGRGFPGGSGTRGLVRVDRRREERIRVGGAAVGEAIDGAGGV